MTRELEWALFEKAVEVTASALRGAMGGENSQPASYAGDVFREMRTQNLARWPTGAEVDFDAAVDLHKHLPVHRQLGWVMRRAVPERRCLTQPRGGFGTFEEICEMITWAQLGIHRKPCGLIDVGGYFDGLLAQFDRAVADGLLRAGHRGLVVSEPDPERLIDHMAAWQPPPLEFHLDWSAT